MDEEGAGVTDNGKRVKATHTIHKGKIKSGSPENIAGRDSISINIPLSLLCVCFWPLSPEIIGLPHNMISGEGGQKQSQRKLRGMLMLITNLPALFRATLIFF